MHQDEKRQWLILFSWRNEERDVGAAAQGGRI
jgi:hypothetical protein